MNLFLHSDYRQIIRLLIEESKGSKHSVTASSLAEAMRVQKPYLSKILNGSADLNSDQLFLLCQYFQLSDEEHEYLGLLVERSRSSLAVRQKILQKRISAIQLRHRKPEKALEADLVQSRISDAMLEYYLDPDLTLVNMYLGLSEFRRNPLGIARKMGISETRLKSLLRVLVKLGLFESVKGGSEYKPLRNAVLLDYESPLSDAHQVLFRVRSAQHMITVPRKERCAFSLTFSADERTRVLIHDRFLKLLKEVEPAIKDAPEEDVFQLNFDLFPWKAD